MTGPRSASPLVHTGPGYALIFVGFHALVKGYLILRSTFLPRILGVRGILGGAGWLILLIPPLARPLLPVILGVGRIGAAATVLRLLVVDVNPERWKEEARAAAASPCG